MVIFYTIKDLKKKKIFQSSNVKFCPAVQKLAATAVKKNMGANNRCGNWQHLTLSLFDYILYHKKML